MSLATYLDVEALVRSWLVTTPVAALVARPGGGHNIFQAMPTGAPLPAIVLTRVGGGPPPRSDVPVDVARISFDCWSQYRTQAIEIARAVAAAIANLAVIGGYVNGSARLEAGEIVSWLWLPDPDSDTPRYVVDARFTALAG